MRMKGKSYYERIIWYMFRLDETMISKLFAKVFRVSRYMEEEDNHRKSH